VEHANFFENRATEYSKASTTGTWEEAFAATPADGLSEALPAE
jgi:ribonucleoside-diphosphate reductase beta chain